MYNKAKQYPKTTALIVVTLVLFVNLLTKSNPTVFGMEDETIFLVFLGVTIFTLFKNRLG